MTLPKPKPYTLDCMHVVYYRIPPNVTDELWCTICSKYEPLLLASTSIHSEIFDPDDDFMAQKIGKKFQGTCLYPGCGEKRNAYANYDSLKKAMHEHYIRSHTKWKVEITVSERLPPGSPPPF